MNFRIVLLNTSHVPSLSTSPISDPAVSGTNIENKEAIDAITALAKKHFIIPHKEVIKKFIDQFIRTVAPFDKEYLNFYTNNNCNYLNFFAWCEIIDNIITTEMNNDKELNLFQYVSEKIESAMLSSDLKTGKLLFVKPPPYDQDRASQAMAVTILLLYHYFSYKYNKISETNFSLMFAKSCEKFVAEAVSSESLPSPILSLITLQFFFYSNQLPSSEVFQNHSATEITSSLNRIVTDKLHLDEFPILFLIVLSYVLSHLEGEEQLDFLTKLVEPVNLYSDHVNRYPDENNIFPVLLIGNLMRWLVGGQDFKSDLFAGVGQANIHKKVSDSLAYMQQIFDAKHAVHKQFIQNKNENSARLAVKEFDKTTNRISAKFTGQQYEHMAVYKAAGLELMLLNSASQEGADADPEAKRALLDLYFDLRNKHAYSPFSILASQPSLYTLMPQIPDQVGLAGSLANTYRDLKDFFSRANNLQGLVDTYIHYLTLVRVDEFNNPNDKKMITNWLVNDLSALLNHDKLSTLTGLQIETLLSAISRSPLKSLQERLIARYDNGFLINYLMLDSPADRKEADLEKLLASWKAPEAIKSKELLLCQAYFETTNPDEINSGLMAIKAKLEAPIAKPAIVENKNAGFESIMALARGHLLIPHQEIIRQGIDRFLRAIVPYDQEYINTYNSKRSAHINFKACHELVQKVITENTIEVAVGIVNEILAEALKNPTSDNTRRYLLNQPISNQNSNNEGIMFGIEVLTSYFSLYHEKHQSDGKALEYAQYVEYSSILASKADGESFLSIQILHYFYHTNQLNKSAALTQQSPESVVSALNILAKVPFEFPATFLMVLSYVLTDLQGDEQLQYIYKLIEPARKHIGICKLQSSRADYLFPALFLRDLMDWLLQAKGLQKAFPEIQVDTDKPSARELTDQLSKGLTLYKNIQIETTALHKKLLRLGSELETKKEIKAYNLRIDKLSSQNRINGDTFNRLLYFGPASFELHSLNRVLQENSKPNALFDLSRLYARIAKQFPDSPFSFLAATPSMITLVPKLLDSIGQDGTVASLYKDLTTFFKKSNDTDRLIDTYIDFLNVVTFDHINDPKEKAQIATQLENDLNNLLAHDKLENLTQTQLINLFSAISRSSLKSLRERLIARYDNGFLINLLMHQGIIERAVIEKKVAGFADKSTAALMIKGFEENIREILATWRDPQSIKSKELLLCQAYCETTDSETIQNHLVAIKTILEEELVAPAKVEDRVGIPLFEETARQGVIVSFRAAQQKNSGQAQTNKEKLARLQQIYQKISPKLREDSFTIPERIIKQAEAIAMFTSAIAGVPNLGPDDQHIITFTMENFSFQASLDKSGNLTLDIEKYEGMTLFPTELIEYLNLIVLEFLVENEKQKSKNSSQLKGEIVLETSRTIQPRRMARAFREKYMLRQNAFIRFKGKVVVESKDLEQIFRDYFYFILHQGSEFDSPRTRTSKNRVKYLQPISEDQLVLLAAQDASILSRVRRPSMVGIIFRPVDEPANPQRVIDYIQLTSFQGKTVEPKVMDDWIMGFLTGEVKERRSWLKNWTLQKSVILRNVPEVGQLLSKLFRADKRDPDLLLPVLSYAQTLRAFQAEIRDIRVRIRLLQQLKSARQAPALLFGNEEDLSVHFRAHGLDVETDNVETGFKKHYNFTEGHLKFVPILHEAEHSHSDILSSDSEEDPVETLLHILMQKARVKQKSAQVEESMEEPQVLHVEPVQDTPALIEKPAVSSPKEIPIITVNDFVMIEGQSLGLFDTPEKLRDICARLSINQRDLTLFVKDLHQFLFDEEIQPAEDIAININAWLNGYSSLTPEKRSEYLLLSLYEQGDRLTPANPELNVFWHRLEALTEDPDHKAVPNMTSAKDRPELFPVFTIQAVPLSILNGNLPSAVELLANVNHLNISDYEKFSQQLHAYLVANEIEINSVRQIEIGSGLNGFGELSADQQDAYCARLVFAELQPESLPIAKFIVESTKINAFKTVLTAQAEKDIAEMPPKLRKQYDIVESLLRNDPYSGEIKKYDLKGKRSFKLTYHDRVLYEIDKRTKTVTILRARTHYGE